MQWPEAGERLFPTPHRAEPENLRRDIIDELADHLALAAEDEVVKHGRSPEAAWKRVIERFGNPNAVARRLWWDAMRERIMRDWIQTGVAAASAVVVVLVAVLVVNGMNQMQTTQMQLIEVLKGMNQSATPAAIALDVEVRRGSESGPFVAGAEVTLAGVLSGETKTTVKLTTDTEGHVRFTPVPPGAYEIGVFDPHSGMTAEVSHGILGGVGSRLKIVAPEYEATPVNCLLNPPLPFPNNRVMARTEILIADRIGDVNWSCRKYLWLSNEGCYELSPGSSYNPGHSFVKFSDLLGPSPTLVLPPRRLQQPLRGGASIWFLQDDASRLAVISGAYNSTSSKVDLQEDTLSVNLTGEQINEAAAYVKAYTFNSRWLGRNTEINYSYQWKYPSLTAGKYLVGAIPLTDGALAVSPEEKEGGEVLLTVREWVWIRQEEGIRGADEAAVFLLPLTGDLAKEIYAGCEILFSCASTSAGSVSLWTGNEWSADPGSRFKVELLDGDVKMIDDGLFDVTEMLNKSKAAAANQCGILLQLAEDGSVILSGAKASREELPYLLIVSETPPPDL